MMKRFLLFSCLCLAGSLLRAQTAEDSVKAVVNEMFAAMKSNDSARLMACFADSAILQSVTVNRKGDTRILNESPRDFAKSIKSMPAGSLDERISFDMIKIDGPLAIAWTPYSFYFNSKFSHCGVNSFQLVRLKGIWKIQYIIDTRRKDCGVK